jgi:hypothetical protein
VMALPPDVRRSVERALESFPNLGR